MNPFRSSLILTLVLGVAAPAVAQPRIFDLRTSDWHCIADPYVYFTLKESREQRDINGDGDLWDVIGYVYDSRTDEVQELPFGRPFTIRGHISMYRVRETTDRIDLNGDGDLLDEVPHVLDLETGILTNLGVSISKTCRFHREFFSMTVSEWGQGRDLNGDGDVEDNILHAYDLHTETLINLELAVHWSYCPTSGFPMAIDAAEEEGRDLNGDGDTDDRILHYFDGEQITNQGDTSLITWTVGRHLIFIGREDGRDLNGDGDTVDQFLGFHDTRDGTTDYFPRSSWTNIGDRWLLLEASESTWQLDLDGDGQILGDALLFYDLETGDLTNPGVRISEFWYSKGHPTVSALSIEERWNGDLNGDGDSSDKILHLFDTAGRFRNTRTPISDPEKFRSGSSGIYFPTPESLLGEDLNGDGDLDDDILHWFDSFHRDPVNLGIPVSGPAGVTDRGAVVLISEEETGVDGNLDGDLDDDIAHQFFVATRSFESLGISARSAYGDRLVSLRVDESDEGGLDINGNGVIGDDVRHILDLGAFPRHGTVNAAVGPSADVLFLNGEAGEDPARIVEYDVGGSLELEMRLPPSLVGTGQTAPYAVYAWADLPTRSTQVTLPFGIGTASHLMPLTGHPWAPDLTWNNAGRFRFLGFPDRDSEPAPSTFLHVPSVRRGFRFFLQGVIFDPASAALVPASLTNAIEARPR